MGDCPEGWGINEGQWPIKCNRTEQPEPPCDKCDERKAATVGNPVQVVGGIKIQTEVDYENASGSLRLARTYRSDDGMWRHNYQVFGVDFNNIESDAKPEFACLNAKNSDGEMHCYRYLGKGTAKNFGLRRGSGRMTYFGNDVDYSGPKDVNDRVSQVTDAGGKVIGWQVANASDDSTESFSLDGRLQRIKSRNGQDTAFTYSDQNTPLEIAPKPGYLLKVTDAYGHSLQFTYTAQGKMSKMIDPAGNAFIYEYDTEQNLFKVTYPDGKSKTYLYDEPQSISAGAGKRLLTGILDENNVRYATYAYNASRRSISTEHAGGVEKYTLTYPYDGETRVTDPLGSRYVYKYSNVAGVMLQTGTSRTSATGNETASTKSEYDANGNLSVYTDFDGTATTYVYDLARNLETSRTEASGSTVARTIQTEWHPTFRTPARVSEPLRRTTYTHDTSGNVLTKTTQATTDTNGSQGFKSTLTGAPSKWTYTYNAMGQLSTMRGPRTDVNDTTTFNYDAEGNLETRTNALGHQTRYSNYDANGRAGRITDPNGLVVDMSYDARGRLKSVTTGGETTGYDYYDTGLLKQATLPDGSAIHYAYDDAHRLTGISDTLGNSITYVPDAMGNRTSEQSRDANGTLTRKITRVYDALNRMKQITGAQQ
ncbi:RHS repeat protein [Pseudoduganella violaceinigra]|uniref:RHS repeat protein n=1 Tax=Pseudoduganella violaceinigra TaxID=246602 RepID=UPI0004171616|nr:RHS repeat protein [Pseudoduganella violaceinigra]